MIYEWYNTVDGSNPANQLRLVVYQFIPLFFRVSYISGGAGFLPSTAVLNFTSLVSMALNVRSFS